MRPGAGSSEPPGGGRGGLQGRDRGAWTHPSSQRRAGFPRCALDMQNDAGEFVDLYVPRKW